MNKGSTDKTALSMRTLEPKGREDADIERQEAERRGIEIPRYRRKKGRTEPLSLRVHPHIKKALIDMATAEDCDLVVIVEKSIMDYQKRLKGER